MEKGIRKMGTANKHGLRAAAKERSAKHAQRTPLPPRAGQVQDARDAIAEAEATLGPALRKLMRKAEKADRDPTAKEIAKAYAKDRAAEAASVVVEAPAGSRAPGVKAAAFIAEATRLGWDTDVKTTGDRVPVDTVTATRGDEAITIEWQADVFMPGCLYVRPDGTSSKLRNASHAKQVMGSPPPTPEQLAARRAVRERIGGQKRMPVRSLPFNPDLMTDEELGERLLGCKIVWVNRISQLEESDIIPPSTRVRVDEGASGRQVHFNSLLGARTVRVSGIIHIAGGMKRPVRTRKAEKAS